MRSEEYLEELIIGGGGLKDDALIKALLMALRQRDLVMFQGILGVAHDSFLPRHSLNTRVP